MAVTERDVFSSLESVVMQGDLSKLSPHDRVLYYKKVCESLGLNPLTKPFDYLTLNGKMMLYARKDATEQLRALHGISIHISARELVDDVYVVTAQATNNNGRKDESIGAVNVGGLKGDAKANAMMKCETKAKRRVTLSIAGLGMMDENEVETIPGAKIEEINIETGELLGYADKEDFCAGILRLAKQNNQENDISNYLKKKGVSSLNLVPLPILNKIFKSLFDTAQKNKEQEEADDHIYKLDDYEIRGVK